MVLRLTCSALPDVVKVRLMTDKNRQLNGVMHCVKTILVNEGPIAFYKGFGMCWGRVRLTYLPPTYRWERKGNRMLT
jgi:hypothetical protein